MFDRTWNVVQPANAAPAAVVLPDVNLPGGEPELELEAWAGNGSGAGTSYIFEGDVSTTDATDRLLAAGRLDCLTVIPDGGVACIRIPSDIEQRLTVFFDTQVAQPQSVTIRIRECYELRSRSRRY